MGRRREPPRPEQVTVTRYQTADGKRCSRSTPGAVKIVERSESYYVRFYDTDGNRESRTPLGTADIGEAWRVLRELLEQRERASLGLSDPTMRHAARPLGEHIDDWIAQLRNGGKTSEDQVKLLSSRVRKLATLARWERLPQIDRDSALRALAAIQKERCRGMALGETGRGAQTRNHYLRHLKQFCTWCVEEGRLARSTVDGIDPVSIEADVRHARRSPATEEVAVLMAYLEGAFTPEGATGPLSPPTRCHMTGPQRGLGYRLSMVTGFRAKELRSLELGSFDLDAGTVRVKGAYSKNKKLAVQHLPAWMVEELREWFAGGGKLWGGFPENWPGRLLLADQKACGIVHETEEGFFDFHALRHWYLTWASNRPNISPKTLQTMARHADPRLTLKVYAKAQNEDIRKVMEDMPRPGDRPT